MSRVLLLSARRHLHRAPSLLTQNQIRRQHDAPHKTYFQDPSHSPLHSAPTTPSSQAKSKTRTWIGLGMRTFAHATTGAALGFAGALTLITWDYMQEVYEAGTEDDLDLLESIEELFDDHVGIIAAREHPDYLEIKPHSFLSAEEQKHSLVSGPLSGSRGVVQKVFWNEKLKSINCFVFFGNGVEGWPDVVHGGTLNIILDEALGRVAVESFPAKTAVTAKLDLAYMKPVRPGTIYQIRAHPDDLIVDMKSGIASVPQTEERRRKATILGVILDAANDEPNTRENTHVEAKGVYVVPRNLELRQLVQT